MRERLRAALRQRRYRVHAHDDDDAVGREGLPARDRQPGLPRRADRGARRRRLGAPARLEGRRHRAGRQDLRQHAVALRHLQPRARGSTSNALDAVHDHGRPARRRRSRPRPRARASSARRATSRPSRRSPTPTGSSEPRSIRVNHPLETGGGSVFLLGNGYAPVITVRDAEGTVLYSDATPFLPQDNNYTSVGAVKVPGASPKQLGFAGFFLPTGEHRRPGPALDLPRRARPAAGAHGLRGRPVPQRPPAVGLLARHRLDDARARQGRRRPAAHPAAPGPDLRAARRPRLDHLRQGRAVRRACRSAPTRASR